MTKLGLMFKNIENENKAKYNSFYTNSNAEIIINESDINDVFELIYTTIISNIQKSLGKGLDWIIYSVIDHNISILKYNALAGRSYIRLPKESDHPRRELIDIQNIDDNECFKWSMVRHLYPINYHPVRVTKADKDFAEKRDFKDIKFPIKIRDIHKIEKNNSIGISVFGYRNKEKHLIYVSKKMLISLVRLLRHIKVKILFTILLIVSSKKVDIAAW